LRRSKSGRETLAAVSIPLAPLTLETVRAGARRTRWDSGAIRPWGREFAVKNLQSPWTRGW